MPLYTRSHLVVTCTTRLEQVNSLSLYRIFTRNTIATDTRCQTRSFPTRQLAHVRLINSYDQVTCKRIKTTVIYRSDSRSFCDLFARDRSRSELEAAEIVNNCLITFASDNCSLNGARVRIYFRSMRRIICELRDRVIRIMKNRDTPFINNSCISQNLCDRNRARNSEFRLYLQAIYRVSINHNLILLIASCYDVASR